ncbi:MAG TPA: phosphoribosylanthranilate isomerase [Sphingomonadales bacterium]
MRIGVKICGLSDPASVAAAVAGGARYLGFVFYGPSPRNIEPAAAAGLAAEVPAGISTVAVTVDATDDELARIAAAHPFSFLQLHGRETPERVREVKARFGIPVIKAVSVAGAEDILKARDYEDAADMLLFDAKPPKSMAGALPGGNGLRFDWDLLGEKWRGARPWMLSGGLDAAVVAEAVAASGATLVDVSSGVEQSPGVKSVDKIRAFLDAVRKL